jgi:hypothetical protein
MYLTWENVLSFLHKKVDGKQKTHQFFTTWLKKKLILFLYLKNVIFKRLLNFMRTFEYYSHFKIQISLYRWIKQFSKARVKLLCKLQSQMKYYLSEDFILDDNSILSV